MTLVLKNKKALNKYILTFAMRIEKALVFNMEVLVAELQNHAKLNGAYEDQTSNLKGSIGGMVLKNGKPISYSGFDDFGDEGNKTGLEYINSLTSNYPRGYAILVVAGMEYATYVENLNNLNVLKASELKMNRELPLVLKRLKKRINALL